MVKYPRTLHLPYSPGKTKDDTAMETVDSFRNRKVVASIKMDGENTTLYNNAIHSRSLTYTKHPSRERLKAFHAYIRNSIPDGFRICIENCYAKHSIHYNNLPAWWFGLSVWENTTCLSYFGTRAWFFRLGIVPTFTFYQGIFDEDAIHNAFQEYCKNSKDPQEGYVVRVSDAFDYSDFSTCVAKYVRENHVQTSDHWFSQTVVPNNKQSTFLDLKLGTIFGL